MVEEQILLSELQVLLAEKRTYYALLRTGLAVSTVPMSVMAFLLATLNYHDIFKHFWLGISVGGGLISISLIGLVLFYSAESKIKKINRILKKVKSQNARIAEILF